jgi:hypothetical protein
MPGGAGEQGLTRDRGFRLTGNFWTLEIPNMGRRHHRDSRVIRR